MDTYNLLIAKEEHWGQYPQIKPVLCPVCGYEYNHNIRVDTIDGQDDYKAWHGRGDVIKVFIQGECGHYWKLCIGFHKGILYTYCEQDSECKDRESKEKAEEATREVAYQAELDEWRNSRTDRVFRIKED